MKKTPVLAVILAASSLIFTACDKKPAAGDGGKASGGGAVSEKDAIESFKKEILEVKAMTDKEKAAAEADPIASMGKMKEVMARVKAIKTDGLPADLKEAFTTAMGKMSALVDVFKDLPEKKEDQMAWMMKLGTDPTFQEKMKTLTEEGDAAFEKLKEIGKKYGIEELGLK